ncbi:vif protein [Simian immunodeficiency virus]|uniref:Virion infectivity factor n=1 Tax=Simian immunodeficiency virus TaxID=11723 RepID=J7FCT3_SIV|nr:vif protein [Simian immunodeficiency virus]
MENRWQVRVVWQIDRMRIRAWNSLVKHHIYKSKHCKEWKYRHHYDIDHPRKGGEVHIPITEKAKLVITIYWGLHCGEKAWHLGHGASIEWRQGRYWTEVDPETADQIIHSRYFPCFTERAIRQAILGEKILQHCHFPTGHSKVGSLQFLAFKKVLEQNKQKPHRPPLPSVTVLAEDRWNKPQRIKAHQENRGINGY